ncbi:MAG: hypothetical protein JRJ15_09950 [Deltaproteobacteria bacterium]|nr:hypothetical protein [Deltaproteobacteria bacterium]
MVRVFAVLLILFPLIWEVVPARAQNPFLSGGKPKQVLQAPAPPNPFLARIVFWQQQLHRKMAVLTREAKETNSIRPFFSLIIIAFAYGLLHAAGPGHGKAVAISYLISHGNKLRRGILVGNLIALFHGLSAVGLVLALNFVLRKGVSGPMESVTRTTQIVSYSLIALLGAGLLARSLILWRRRINADRAEQKGDSEKGRRFPLSIALAVGMVAFSLTLGMAATISAVGVAVIAGKNLTFKSISGRHRLTKIIEQGTEIVGALMVMVLGLLFLAVTV